MSPPTLEYTDAKFREDPVRYVQHWLDMDEDARGYSVMRQVREMIVARMDGHRNASDFLLVDMIDEMVGYFFENGLPEQA